MKKALLREAIRIAIAHYPNHPSLGTCWLHYSFIIQDNTLIEWGMNMKGMPPKHYGYNKKISDGVHPAKLHAEIVAYRRAIGLMDRTRKFSVVNVRVTHTGVVKNSCPCGCCKSWMESNGASEFWHTTDVGCWAKLGLTS
jgi:hypothetical protein